MLVFADRPHLRSARLAAHRETGLGNAFGVGRAALLVDDRVHAVENDGQHTRIDAKSGKVGRRKIAARRQHALRPYEARDDGTARNEACSHDGELQRCRQHRPLPDTGNQRFALRPGGTGGCLLPLFAGDQSGTLAGDVNTEYAAETEPPRHRREAFNTQSPRGLVEIDVTRSLDCIPQTDGAVPALAPAVKRGTPEFEIPRTGYGGLGGQHSGGQRRCRNYGLEGRPRRVDPGHHFVG